MPPLLFKKLKRVRGHMSGFLRHTQTKTTSDGLLQDELLLYVEYKLLLLTI